LYAVVTLTSASVPHPDDTNSARAEIDRVLERGLSDDDLAEIRAAPEHDPEEPCPTGTVLIEDPEGTLRAVPVPNAIQAALPRMFPRGGDKRAQ
jgi:hypothetical protein